MPAPSYRFGSFFVDRVRYEATRAGIKLELTPKLLDLLLHLLDRAGSLVTKEELLDTLWPGANVTENAIAQAVSELRQALGDAAASPRFIKTIARRGYRFIAPVQAVSSEPAAAAEQPSARMPTSGEPAIAVMEFANVSGEPDSAWLAAGIAETVTGDLRALERFRVIDRGRVMEATRRTNGTLRDVSAELGVSLVVVGSYQRYGERIRINSRIVNVDTGEALADAKVDGPLDTIFELQDRVVAQFSKELGLAAAAAGQRGGGRETPSLEAYRLFTEGWLQLETLDVREIPKAIASFERAIAIDPRYALAYTGLANAQVAAFEATRSENTPAQGVLESAIAHARRAVQLDESLAEAHATLAFGLVSAWATIEALRSARRAVALEPSNWRHFFRLGHASWGDERLQAAATTLTLYPDFAFAHFQAAMVHVARGHLQEAETVLRQGAAVQDRQTRRGDRYPALGLHWLLGLVRLAGGDSEEALREFDREYDLAAPHRLYGREYKMTALYARGACLLEMERTGEATECFRAALALYPDHAQSTLGLMLALRRSGARAEADRVSAKMEAILARLAAARPLEHGIVKSQVLAVEGDAAGAATVLRELLGEAPPGFAGWTLPVEPALLRVSREAPMAIALARLADRAE